MRPSIEVAKRIYNNKPIVCVEIGVLAGVNAESILSNLNVKTLYLIDPYIYFDRLWYYSNEENDKMKSAQQERDNLFESTKKMFTEKYGSKTQFIRKKSEDAIHEVPDELDFVYIDGNHQYEYAKKDIELYYPKLKVGAVCGGHDYHRYQVRKAINEFAHTNRLIVHRKEICENDDNVDFWIIKK